MTDDTTIAVSSRTGNTQKIADAVCAQLDELDVGYCVREAGEPVEGQNVIICFWCFKSRFDVRNKNLLAELSGEKILVFGTFGGYPDSAYADKVRRNVIGDASEHKRVSGRVLESGQGFDEERGKAPAAAGGRPAPSGRCGGAAPGRVAEASRRAGRCTHLQLPARTPRGLRLGACRRVGGAC